MTDSKALAEHVPAKLTLSQERFCELFASEAETFGNGTQSYIEAYHVDLTKKGAYAAARACASRLLTKANILTRIDELLESATLNNTFVDKQLAFLIAQNADFGAKMSAIKEYNALKKRIAQSTGQVNIIQLILKKWGLDDVEQIDWDEGAVPQDGA